MTAEKKSLTHRLTHCIAAIFNVMLQVHATPHWVRRLTVEWLTKWQELQSVTQAKKSLNLIRETKRNPHTDRTSNCFQRSSENIKCNGLGNTGADYFKRLCWGLFCLPPANLRLRKETRCCWIDLSDKDSWNWIHRWAIILLKLLKKPKSRIPQHSLLAWCPKQDIISIKMCFSK